MSILRVFCTLLAVIITGAGTGEAQVPPNCTVETASDPDRQILACDFGVVLEMEAAAQMGFVDESQVVDLQSGAVLIEAETGEARPQIRTPHAIAAVRGTIYVVDVKSDTTSVFVIEGEVAVSPASGGGEGVLLGSGEGVDVGSSGEIPEASAWPANRARALLARFGR
ncbi:FecR family protein [uncultured Roseobacter sp.]|uniref:FecR family protein n=1 Tax=uncultured Roseobacter sp. TaxID=114847 RepID=UPI002631C2F1|nr:FecR family protein [uncultured Roseobacter sp.]